MIDPTLLTLLIIAGLAVAGIALIPIFLSVSAMYPYAYTNARIRAMRAKLLKGDQIENYVTRPYNDIVYSLEKHTYPQLSKFLGADFSYGSMDTALRTSLIRTLAKVKKIVPNSSKKFVSILLSKYDIQIIETIVRSSRLKVKSKGDVLHITEVFSEEFIARKAHNLDSLHNELKGTVYEPVLNKHMDALKKGKFLDFEIELDLLFFRRLRKAAKSSEAKTYTKKLIDRHNVSLALKGMKPLIEGGRIPLSEFSLNDTLDDLIGKLNKHNYHVKAKTKETLERALQLHLKDFANALFGRNPLSEAPIIGFIILKSINVRNLNILLKLKYHNFSEERIREVLAL